MAIELLSHVAGDMGGYLGLLIGASVITLFEFLDLLLYNIVVKLIWKNQKAVGSEECDVEGAEEEADVDLQGKSEGDKAMLDSLHPIRPIYSTATADSSSPN